MSASPQPAEPVRFVGLEPALPWPLAGWRWWTEPVAAERLAALRIGLASFLLIDILCTYLPNLDMFFAEGAGSGARVFSWYTQAPRWTWSVLRGLGDPLIGTLLLLGWIGLGLGIVFDWFTPPIPPFARGGEGGWPSGIGVKWRVVWLLFGVGLVGSSWDRVWNQPEAELLFWIAPCTVAAAALIALAVEIVLLLLGRGSRAALIVAAVSLVVLGYQLALAILLDTQDVDIPVLRRLLRPWQEDAALLHVAAILWAVSAGMLALGCLTRSAAIATFVFNTSFVNLNPNIDNAGDVIRCIIVFYLMLCPCGAVWSLDRIWQRIHQPAAQARERIVISPWALRLLFVQLVLIYFMNGLYKLGGANWWSGDSLYYVLCDVTLTRFSYAQFPVPLWVTRLATWSVLLWEVGFPLLVSVRWTRKPALWFGVLFHVCIYVSMELGNFVPYILTLYLPLLPWEKMTRSRFRAK